MSTGTPRPLDAVESVFQVALITLKRTLRGKRMLWIAALLAVPVYGQQAVDPEQRLALALETLAAGRSAEAEAELKKGCVSHNYFWFYQFAMQSAINNREWDWLEHFRKGLAFYDPEPRTLWSTFFINRSRVLESYYRDRVTEAVEKKRLELIAICNRHSMLKSVRELEAVAT